MMIRIKRWHAVLPLALLLSTPVLAGVPYHDRQYVFRQPDGTLLPVLLDGNDYHAEQRTRDGALLVYDPVLRGLAHAVVTADGQQLASTGRLARPSAGTAVWRPEPGLSPEARRLAALARYRLRMGPVPHVLQPRVIHPAATGSVRGLTVLIAFPDVPGTLSQDQVDRFLNQIPYGEFGNAQSVRGYYRTVSGGALDYSNVTTRYHVASRPKAYYADSSQDASVRSGELIAEVLAQLKAEGFDFSQLSLDGNGRIRGLNFLYAGGADSSWATGLWPHMARVWPQFCAGAVCTGDYQISNMGSALAIGTFVHETGHLLFGWPDLYDYDGSSYGSVADFCLMGYGAVGVASQFRPVPPNGVFRSLAGWDRVVELNPARDPSAPTGTLTATSEGHVVYRWSNPANPAEAFYIEAIRKSGQNLNQPDEGLAVWHVDPAGNNSDEWHPYVQMEHADGRRDPERRVNTGDADDLYDGTSVAAFDAGSPNALASRGTNALWWNGQSSGLSLRALGRPDQSMQFSLAATVRGQRYRGNLGEHGQDIVPSPWFRHPGGPLSLSMQGPDGTDFDLTLEVWGPQKTWVRVASSTSSLSRESIRYAAEAGYYRATVYAYAGTGAYVLTIDP